MSSFKDKHCKELAFQHLFPTEKYGYKGQRDIPLSPVKYFNQRLLSCSQKFASDSDCIFFVHSVLHQMQYSYGKSGNNKLNCMLLTRNFKETVQQLIASNETSSFTNAIKVTPAYWKKILHDVFAKVKDMDLPTFFLTLSCAYLRWNQLIH